MKRILLSSIACTILFVITFPSWGYELAGADPVITTTAGYTEFETGKGAVTIDPGVSISDEDSDMASKAIIKLTNRPDGGNEFIIIDPEVVDLAEENGLTVNYDFTKGELTIIGSASMATYQEIIRKLNYNNLSSVPDITDRLVAFTVFDEEGNQSESQTRIIRIKNVQGVITNVVVSDDGLYGIEDNITVSFIFNKPIWVEGGSPYIVVNVGGEEVNALYVSGSGTNTIVFSYTVAEGDVDDDGIGVNTDIVLEGATFKDNIGDQADLTFSEEVDASGVLVDGIRPYVCSITMPDDGSYSSCGESKLVFKLSMSEAVSVEGTGLKLNFKLDSGTKEANFIAGESTAEELVFVYEVASGDMAEAGIVLNGLVLNDVLILDLAENELTDLTFTQTGAMGDNNIIIDGTAPAKPEVISINPDSGSNSEDGITNSSAISVHGKAEAGVTVKVLINGDEVGEVQADEEGNWVFDASSLGLVEGIYELSAKAVDASCNESETSNVFALTVDLSGPELTGVNKVVELGADGTVEVSAAELVESVSDNFTAQENIVLEISLGTFTCDHIGENEVTITATDIAGNATSKTVVVTVESNVEPELVIQDLNLELDETGNVTITYSDVVKELSGGCYSLDQFTFELSKSSFSCDDAGGTHTVQITGTDPSGKTFEYEFSVTVADNLAPVITGTEDNLEIFVDETGEYVLDDFLSFLSITDNCSIVANNQSPASGTIMSGYNEPFEVTILAMDNSGNMTEKTISITLKSNIISSVINPEAITVGWGTELGDLSLPEMVEVELLSGEIVEVGVTWDITNYDNTSPGEYQNSGTLVLEGEFTNPGQVQPTVTIVVLEKEMPLDIELSDEEFSVEDDPNAPLGILTTVDPDDDVHTYGLSGDQEDEQYFYILGDRVFWNPENMPENQSQFSITVTSTDRVGNTISKTFVIKRTKPALDDLTIPNVFSPNGDGINDEWGISALMFYEAVKLMVFERSGKMVFLTQDPGKRWDGKYEGKELPVGSYYYVIELGEKGQKRRGVITLIRD